MQNDQQPKKQEEVLKKIQSGEVRMRPKYYFMLQTALFMIAAILLFAIAVFLVSFIFFLGRGGSRYHLHFFLESFPWLLIGGSLLLIGILIFILKRYEFAYRRPLIYLPVAVIAVVLAASLIAQFYSFHERFESYAMRRRLPGLAPLYRRSLPPEKLHEPLDFIKPQYQLQKYDLN